MCNLSQGIVERTTKRVTESITESVTANVTIALSTEYTISLMDTCGIGVDEAMEKLKVAEKYRESVKAAVEARLAQGAVANL